MATVSKPKYFYFGEINIKRLKEFLFFFFVLNVLLIPADAKGINTSEVKIKLDKESYSPFSRVNISVISSNSNTDSMKPDKVYVDIRTKTAIVISLIIVTVIILFLVILELPAINERIRGF